MSDTRVPILLVEDESAHAHLICRAFDSHDFAVDLTVADTLEAARRSIARSAPELIITDLLLPDGRGTDLLPATGAECATPVIVMTSFGNEQSAVASLRAGALDYVVKSRDTLAHMPQVARRVLLQWKITMERKRAQQLLEVQHALAVSLGSAGGVRETARRLLEATVEIEGLDCGGVYLVDPHTGELNLVAHRGCAPAFVEEVSHYDADTPKARIVMEGEPLYSHYRRLAFPVGEASRLEDLRAVAVVPVKHEGEVVAAVDLASHTHDEIDLDTRHTLETLVVPIGGVIARARTEGALRESERKYRALVEGALQGIIVIQDARLRFANSAAAEMAGVSVRRAQALTTRELLRFVPREDRSALIQRYRDGAAGKPPPPRHERRLVRPDGSVFWVDVFVRSVLYDGRPAVQVAFVDITERKQAEDSLAAAKRVAETANRAKSEFLANMSHEIRTPMTAILGFVDLLMSLELPASERRQHLATIHRNAQSLLVLVNNILDLSKIEADRLELEEIRCCPRELVNDVVSLMRIRAQDKNLSLEVDYLFPLPATIQTDSVRLRQILVNLIGNAIKFTENGHVRVSLRFDPRADKAAPLEFQVADSGIGMSQEEVCRLFEPFTQGDASTTRRFGGTGLGLAISQELAGMLGGRIDVTSRPGQGSTFTLRVNPGATAGSTLLESPRGDRMESSSAAKAAPETMGSLSTPTYQGRVLLAEDTEDTQHLITLVLQHLGLEVDAAQDGLAACRMALASRQKGRPYALVLMDIQMPRRDGHEATRDLRRQGWKDPIVAITAHAMTGDREKCLASGCDDYLAKPLRHEDLLGVLSRFLTPAEAPPDSASAAYRDDRSPSGIVGSSHLSEEQQAELLRTFSRGLAQRTEQIQRALESNDLGLLIEAAHALKGTAGLFGFDQISAAAHHVERQGRVAGADARKIRSSTLRLLNLCQEAAGD